MKRDVTQQTDSDYRVAKSAHNCLRMKQRIAKAKEQLALLEKHLGELQSEHLRIRSLVYAEFMELEE